jgi:hypothetical protein
MTKLVLFTITMLSISANADTFGVMFLNSTNTEAKLLVSEGSLDGPLSHFFDQMKVPQTGSPTRQSKAFTLKNGRFGFTCNKGLSPNTLPSTNCVFIVKQGENNGDIHTVISKAGDLKTASVDVSKVISSELNGIFPADANNSISYAPTFAKNVTFDVHGSASGNMTIVFSAK